MPTNGKSSIFLNHLLLVYDAPLVSMTLMPKKDNKPRTLGSFIRELRKEKLAKEYTQKEFAKLLDLGGRGHETVSRWEKGHRFPEEPQIDRLLALHNPPLTLGQCLYFPDEVSAYREAEVFIENLKKAKKDNNSKGDGSGGGDRKKAPG